MTAFQIPHLGPWLPTNPEEKKLASTACRQIIETLLPSKEENADLDSLLVQTLSHIASHTQECEKVIEICMERLFHGTDSTESYCSPSRCRALLLLRTLHTHGYAFTDADEMWIRKKLLPLMEYGNASQVSPDQGDVLPEVFKTLTAMAFPWHMIVAGKTAALHLLAHSLSMSFSRMATAIRLGAVPLLGHTQRPDTMEKHLLSVVEAHKGIARNRSLYESHCYQIVALITHAGGIALVDALKETFELKLSRQNIKPVSQEEFQQNMILHCTRLLEEQALQEVLLEAPPSRPSRASKKRL